MQEIFVRSGGAIIWRQSSVATTPPAATQTILRPHFSVIAKRRVLVARTYGTTASAGQTIKRPIFTVLAKQRVIVWRNYGTSADTGTVKVGGDDVPRIEVWTYKKKEREVEKIVRKIAEDKIIEPVPTRVIEAVAAAAMMGTRTTEGAIVDQLNYLLEDDEEEELLMLLA